jgi:hypothetical protein
MKKITKKVSQVKPKLVKIKEKELETGVKEVLLGVVETTTFKVGDVLIDKSSGKRLHYHNQSVVDSQPERFIKV